MQRGAVLCRKAHVRQATGLRFMRQRTELGDRRPDLIGDLAPMLAGAVSIVPGEGDADPAGGLKN